MKKFLLSAAVMAMTAMSAQALDLPLDDLGSGWGDTTYDPSTHTITYVGDWTGKGWWLGDVDYSQYTHVEVEVAPLTIQVQMAVQYVGASDSDNSGSGICNLGETKIVTKLNDAFKAHTQQIYIQCASITDNPTVTILSAKVVDNSGTAPDLVLWSGEQEIDWWGNAVTLVPAKFENLEVGNDLAIDYTINKEVGALKLMEVMAGWSENKILPAFAALPAFDAQYETVNIGTQGESGTFKLTVGAEDVEILKNPSNIQFMITGDGVIVTKVEIVKESGFSDIIAPVKGDGQMYNLMGVPVDSNYKGIVIKDGKKYYNR